MNETDIKELVWTIANESAANGPGWAQEGVVLREVRNRLETRRVRADLRVQQMILNAWHDFFVEKRLAWGYDLDNPNSPFFHVR